MGHQLSRYGPSSLSMGIYIDMVRLSKYGRNIWNISRVSYDSPQPRVGQGMTFLRFA